jgi:hypothetical protein
MASPEKYGDYYWCVKSDLSKDGEIYIHADNVIINDNGDLILSNKSGRINFSVAKGSWTACFAASAIDGCAVAAERWEGEVKR